MIFYLLIFYFSSVNGSISSGSISSFDCLSRFSVIIYIILSWKLCKNWLIASLVAYCWMIGLIDLLIGWCHPFVCWSWSGHLFDHIVLLDLFGLRLRTMSVSVSDSGGQICFSFRISTLCPSSLWYLLFYSWHEWLLDFIQSLSWLSWHFYLLCPQSHAIVAIRRLAVQTDKWSPLLSALICAEKVGSRKATTHSDV